MQKALHDADTVHTIERGAVTWYLAHGRGAGNVWRLYTGTDPDTPCAHRLLFMLDSLEDLVAGVYEELVPGIYMCEDEELLYCGHEIPAGRGSFSVTTEICTAVQQHVIFDSGAQKDFMYYRTSTTKPGGDNTTNTERIHSNED